MGETDCGGSGQADTTIPEKSAPPMPESPNVPPPSAPPLSLMLLDPQEVEERAVNDPQPSSPMSSSIEDDDCVICLAGMKTHIIVPCGHQCMCQKCAENNNIKTCPI